MVYQIASYINCLNRPSHFFLEECLLSCCHSFPGKPEREKFRLESGIMYDGKYDKVRQASDVLKFNFYLPVLVTPVYA